MNIFVIIIFLFAALIGESDPPSAHTFPNNKKTQNSNYSFDTMNSANKLSNNNTIATDTSNHSNSKELYELRKEFLEQKERTYDSFMFTVTVLLAVFAIIVAFGLGFGFWKSFQDLNAIKDDVKKEMKKNFDDQAQSLIENVMKDQLGDSVQITTQKIEYIENYLKDLKEAIEQKRPIPEFVEDENIQPQNSESKDNIFEGS